MVRLLSMERKTLPVFELSQQLLEEDASEAACGERL